ncbi:hypothetical protein P175DRAFT_0556954 [Aspergillus ochraceoroseus IBT 24754]|uniref:Uncharacterized protein n=2 Tax=Aspergillus ochraceoroseus TaxID=138278 RepID=A0A2T5M0E3_9EURO|nr:uncharacterized protein P175DRAFT_0556954 [Aspergillus ochraceoroseus IBT 24754]KKK13636.1 hypothetical protein AOCH_003264 [Aspergillus ochraceoroseus]PTU22004.1 hypothetical protein P175DRAFT_0556954 [Aspergillus ochraceoroseus IBT 24754]
MTNSAYFNTVTSESAFRTRFNAEGGRLFSDIHHVAASEWGRDHLFACRVIRRETQHNILPFLSEYKSPPDVEFSSEIHAFLRGPDSTYLSQSEHGLVRDSGYGISLAQIWAAMAMIKAQKDLRRKVLVDGSMDEKDYVDSSILQVGSSSPQADSSYEASSIGYIDMETHMLMVSPEDETLRLASCVIRHNLCFAPPQDSCDLQSVVEFRDAKSRLAVSTPILRRKIVATDDGGLCRRLESGDVFTVGRERVAIVEAKKQFQCLENGRPIISDNCFAQMTCEALVARLADPFTELGHGSVILIHVTQHYMCFLHFQINDEYLRDFESAAPSNFIYVTSTPWFDLTSRNGRDQVVQNLSCIMRWAAE